MHTCLVVGGARDGELLSYSSSPPLFIRLPVKEELPNLPCEATAEQATIKAEDYRKFVLRVPTDSPRRSVEFDEYIQYVPVRMTDSQAALMLLNGYGKLASRSLHDATSELVQIISAMAPDLAARLKPQMDRVKSALVANEK